MDGVAVTEIVDSFLADDEGEGFLVARLFVLAQFHKSFDEGMLQALNCSW